MVDGPRILNLDNRLASIEHIGDSEAIERWTKVTGLLRYTLTQKRKKLFGIE